LTTSTEHPSTADLARRDAETAAARSAVVVKTASEPHELRAIDELWEHIWGNTGDPIVGFSMLRALAHAGNYVGAAYDVESRDLVGAAMGFFAAPAGRVLHSDIAGVAESARGRKLGFALKLHQRSWALDRGIDEITWTYDPLIARNAYFNLAKLGGTIVRYYTDFYGDLDDAINAGQGSDRLLVSWRLTSPEVMAACGAGPARVRSDQSAAPWVLTDDSGPIVHELPDDQLRAMVAVPRDIESLRRADPHGARAWRTAVRDTLGAELDAGGQVLGFDRSGGYLVQRAGRSGQEQRR
jgi:predicted GNAT superfamily acetyltransferase